MSVEAHDWTVIQETQKLKIFFKLWRFSLWALYTSIGCMMRKCSKAFYDRMYVLS